MGSRILLTAFLLLTTTAPELSAQVRTWYRPVPRYGMGFGGNPYGGGAFGQGTGTPYADVIRSAGEYNLNTAEAAISYEEARSRYIDNKLKWQQTYFQIKQLGKENREAYYAEQKSARDRWLASGVTTGPARLTSTQLDPSTAKLYWPSALQGPEYAAGREKLDQLFELRASTRSVAGLSGQIRDVARAMQAQLKLSIRDLVPSEYLEARKFLESIVAEAQFAAGT